MCLRYDFTIDAGLPQYLHAMCKLRAIHNWCWWGSGCADCALGSGCVQWTSAIMSTGSLLTVSWHVLFRPASLGMLDGARPGCSSRAYPVQMWPRLG